MDQAANQNTSLKDKIAALIIAASPLLLFMPFISPGIALLLGVAIALGPGNPLRHICKSLSPRFLAIAVIGLGAGMNLNNIIQAGIDGLGYTAVGIAFALGVGLVLGRLFRVGPELSLLIATGTAICGGSAIAAIAAVINAKDHDITIAIAVVFVLNGIALLLFPPLGHMIGLNETQFGLWSAMAIHDTSSVVGATASYGALALETGTTVKLVRALWIIPLTFAVGAFWGRIMPPGDGLKSKPKRPWFILGFLMMAALFTWLPAAQDTGILIADAAKRLMVLTLFLIGANLTRESLLHVGRSALWQGILLWASVSIFTLWLI